VLTSSSDYLSCRIRNNVYRSRSFLQEINQGIENSSIFVAVSQLYRISTELQYNFCLVSLMQITFVCLIYPVLVLCYAGQAAFISKHWNGTENFNHLSESVPSKFFTDVLCCLMAASPGIYVSNLWKPLQIQNIFVMSSFWYLCLLQL
jgi:hypothetical protein